ncbi:MAG: glycosyltransferase family 39 protein [Nitrospirota bacterium]
MSRASSFSWRESILAAAVVWGLLLTIITEALSTLGALSYPAILSSWLLSGAALAVLYLWCFMDKGLISVSVRPVASLPLLFVLPIGFIVALTGLTAFVAPPNNYDSLTYHLGRVVHWVQNHSVQHYPTTIDRQLYMPPWAEFAVTHYYVLSEGDFLSNGVQWFSMLGSLTGVSLIAKQLGGNKESQLFAALIAACLPMGILQASSTQTDYVVTFWLVCFVHYMLRLLEVSEQQLPLWAHSSLAGLSLGLAILTKPTAYLLAAPFLAWFALSMVRRWGVGSAKIVLAITAIAVVVNCPHYFRNVDVYASPLGPQSITAATTNMSVIARGEVSQLLSTVASNLMRNTASEMTTPFYYANRMMEVVVGVIEAFVFRNRDANEFRLSKQQNHQNHEDYSGNPIHLFLIVFCGAVLIGKARRGHVSVIQYFALTLFVAFLAFFLFLRWNVWITRLHLPLFVLGASVIAVTFSGPLLVRARTGIVVLLVVASQFALLYNETRPLIGGKSIFVVPRLEQYFRNKPNLFPQYSHAVFLLKDKLCTQVGFLSQDMDSVEYPLWVMLEGGAVGSLRIEHFRVANQSAKASAPGGMSDFIPCGLVAVDMSEWPDLIREEGREYGKAWMGKEAAVYEIR